MTVCIILHNLIVEDEHGVDLPIVQNHEWPGSVNPPINQSRNVVEIRDLIGAYKKIRNAETCSQLQLDLIDHIWNMHGNDANGESPNP
jgi:hypothetical protein